MKDNFANQLKIHRKKLGISQEELAERLGITPQSVSKWESGKSYPDTTKLVEIAGILGVSLDTLVFGNDPISENAKENSSKSIERIEQAVNDLKNSIDQQKSKQEKIQRPQSRSKKRAIIITFIVACSVLLSACAIIFGIYIYRGSDSYIFGIKYVDGGVEITALRNESRILENGHLEIPSAINGKSVVSIGSRAFSGNMNIESVKIPDSVSIINSYAFSSCKNLKQVNIGNGVKTIGVEAFAFCEALRTIKLSARLEKIELCAFAMIPNLDEIIIPSNTKEIANSAFWGTYLERVYYFGAPNEWSNISISPVQNEGLLNATRYYYSEVQPPSTNLKYFYFNKNGEIAHWDD